MTLVRPLFVVFGALTVLCGVVYPALVTVVAQVTFHDRANGSLVRRDGVVVGLELVGQQFDDPRYFWGRPSATPTPYDASASSGSNLGPLHPDLASAVSRRVASLALAQGQTVPVDLVTTSGSGLDPHVSPAAAAFQVQRVATARGLSAAEVQALVDRHVEPPLLGIFGGARVNVLDLNLALDADR